MAGSLITPAGATARDYGDQAHSVVQGTGTLNDAKLVPWVVAVDAATGVPLGTSSTATLQNAATANGNGTSMSVDGQLTVLLFISNGAGTATLTIQGSRDAAFAVAQDAFTLPVVKITDSAGGADTAPAVVNGALSIAANTSYLYQVNVAVPNLRAVISAAAGLGAGTSVTGLSVTAYVLGPD